MGYFRVTVTGPCVLKSHESRRLPPPPGKQAPPLSKRQHHWWYSFSKRTRSHVLTRAWITYGQLVRIGHTPVLVELDRTGEAVEVLV